MYDAICPNLSGSPFISPSVLSIASAVFFALCMTRRRASPLPPRCVACPPPGARPRPRWAGPGARARRGEPGGRGAKRAARSRAEPAAGGRCGGRSEATTMSWPCQYTLIGTGLRAATSRPTRLDRARRAGRRKRHPAIMSAAANVLLPRLFGRYALFDFIGKGGMAEIYLARQKTELGPAAAMRREADPARARAATRPSATCSFTRRSWRHASATRTSCRCSTWGAKASDSSSRWSTSRGSISTICCGGARAPRCRCPSSSASTSCARRSRVSTTPTGARTTRADRSGSCIATCRPRTCSCRSRAR